MYDPKRMMEGHENKDANTKLTVDDDLGDSNAVGRAASGACRYS